MPDLTPIEVQRLAKLLVDKIGGRAHIFVSIADTHRDLPIHGALYTNWPNAGSEINTKAETWAELMDDLDRLWDEYEEENKRRKTQEMALEIIRITTEQGECTDAALRGFSFTARDVEQYGEDACLKADEMAGKGPFVIINAAKANAA